MEHEETFFFAFRLLLTHELLKVTTKLPIKLNNPVIDVVT
jgi:hypothetical protein